jgi:ribonuclease HI
MHSIRFTRLLSAISDRGVQSNIATLMMIHEGRWFAMHDASHLPEVNKGGVGALLIAPDGKAHAFWAAMASEDPTQAEMAGTVLALAAARSLGVTELVLAGDSRQAIKNTSSYLDGQSPYPALTEAYKSLQAEFAFLSRAWVPRTDNQVADRLAAAGRTPQTKLLAQMSLDAGFWVARLPEDSRLGAIPGYQPYGMTAPGVVVNNAKRLREALFATR